MLLEKDEPQKKLELVNESNGEYSKLGYAYGGISKSVNWQGGGFFTYFELKKYNQILIEQIEAAKDLPGTAGRHKNTFENQGTNESQVLPQLPCGHQKARRTYRRLLPNMKVEMNHKKKP